tara:strand:+ start:13220 stop:13486 length:267 start_codon:yes stop_codon:yes gene_type:complete
MPVLRSNQLPTLHPGIVLKRYYLDRYNINLSNAAEKLGIKTYHLNNFINGKVTVTGPLATKLESVTGISSGFWLNLQKNYNLYIKWLN